jgi:hypothetical protein
LIIQLSKQASVSATLEFISSILIAFKQISRRSLNSSTQNTDCYFGLKAEAKEFPPAAKPESDSRGRFF